MLLNFITAFAWILGIAGTLSLVINICRDELDEVSRLFVFAVLAAYAWLFARYWM